MFASLLLLKTDLRPPVSAGTMPSSTSSIRTVPASRPQSDDSLRDSNLLRGHLHPQQHRQHAQQCTVTTTAAETTTASARTSSSTSSSCLCQLTKNSSGGEKRASLVHLNPSTPTCCRTASAPCGHPPRSSCFSSSSSSSSSAWSPLALLILLTSLGVTLAMPLSDNEKHYRELQSRAVKYLAQFGYLSGPSTETGNLMSADDLTRAIKKLQKMGRIPETGVIDRRTEELMSKPRCGNLDTGLRPDSGQVRSDLGREESNRAGRRKRYTQAPSKWGKKDLSFKLLNYTPDMDITVTRETIRNAFKVWSDATQLTFTEVTLGNHADILIQFASRYHQDGYPFDGKGMILAHAFFPGEGKGGDTHFDDDERWTSNSTDGVDLFMVAAHEFGHALGLAHSADPGALMYPWYQGFSGPFVLPHDDSLGIQSLYGPPRGPVDFDNKSTVSLIPESIPLTPDGTNTVNPTPGGDDEVPPDPCTTPFDAITVIRTEVFLFIGKWFWRMDSRNILEAPVHIHKFWYGLPKTLTKIDAVFERPGDKKIVFFSGDRYWTFNANHMVAGFPSEGRPITEFGIPADVKHIDTVFIWGFNQRTYLVYGDMYWKLDVNNTYVEYDYPRDMSIWRGVPIPLDAAFQYWDGKTYFFQKRMYWKFYDVKMQVDPYYPKSIADHWLQCSKKLPLDQPAKQLEQISSKASSQPFALHFVFLLTWSVLFMPA